MESMTDWAFSWPISAQRSSQFGVFFVVENWEGEEKRRRVWEVVR